MISLKERKLEDLIVRVKERLVSYPSSLTDSDLIESLKTAILKLNEALFFPRTFIKTLPGRELDLTDLNIDEIVNVYFPNESFNLNYISKDIGLIPLISRTSPFLNFDSIIDFLVFKGSLNMMYRHLRYVGDWEYMAPILHLNRADYSNIIIEALIYLDESQSSWLLFENEYQFIINFSFYHLMLKQAEILMTSQFLGVGKEYPAIVDYWNSKLDKLITDWNASKVLSYVG